MAFPDKTQKVVVTKVMVALVMVRIYYSRPIWVAHSYLISLPWQSAFEQEDERVGKTFQIVPSGGHASKMRMDTGIPHCAPAYVNDCWSISSGLSWSRN